MRRTMVKDLPGAGAIPAVAPDDAVFPLHLAATCFLSVFRRRRDHLYQSLKRPPTPVCCSGLTWCGNNVPRSRFVRRV
eukprot:g14802.t1